MRETKSARLTRMHDEYDILRQVIPAPACALHFSNPLELLIATVLSAQTTDKRVNTVTPELFATYPTARDLAAANPAQVEDIIHPLGFYRSKTQHLIGLATALDERFGGVVPRTMDELTSLPGGRPQNRERRARQRVRYPRIPGRYACDARNRTTALAVGLAVRTPRSRENREGNHLLFSARRVDESQPPTDSVRPGHLPRTYP